MKNSAVFYNIPVPNLTVLTATCLAALLMSLNAFAGIRIGNGGNSIVCADRTISLDLYEGEFQNLFHYQPETLPWKEILAHKLERLENVKTPPVQTLRTWFAQFDGEVNFVNADLGTIDDSLHVIIPKDCKVVQTVNQQFTPLPDEKRYVIAKRIWDQLPEWDRAALILHEFAYRYLQQENSVNARYFTALVFSQEVVTMSPQSLQAKFTELGFR